MGFRAESPRRHPRVAIVKVLVDTQILIFLHPKPASKMTAEQKEFHVRARILAEQLTDRKDTLVVPTICIGEYLVGCDSATWVHVVREFSERFSCPSYDLPAAQATAKVRQHFAAKLKGTLYKDRRNVLSADSKILGTAIAQGVSEIYTVDKDFRKLANDFIKSYDLPKKSDNMFIEQFVRDQLPP